MRVFTDRETERERERERERVTERERERERERDRIHYLGPKVDHVSPRHEWWGMRNGHLRDGWWLFFALYHESECAVVV